MVLDRAVGVVARRRRRRRRAGLAVGLALLLIFAAAASAELTQRGNLFVRFDGGISPQVLPRDELAPIAVRIEGTVRVLDGEDPPALRRITVALNRAGQLSTHGLPTCRRDQLTFETPADALAACGPALVGSGGIVARTTLPDQRPTTVRLDMLLFNGVVDGRPAVLAHTYQTRPVTLTRIVVFEIRRNPGVFGTVLSARITPEIERNGYLKSIFLQLQRRYVVDGQRRAYLSASCAAPPGVYAAAFPFARAEMRFEDGRRLASTLVRSCRVDR